jgi:CheY-like chemotaxis protein
VGSAKADHSEPIPAKRVLVVDDNRHVRQTLPYVLREEGYEVEVAANGEEAFKIACQRPVDLVLADISMPDVDGIELIRLIRQDHFLRALPIVAMTAFGGQRCEDARDAGATVCLEKPLRHGELVALLGRLTQQAH